MPRKYDLEFKINAVRLVLEEGIPITKACDDLGVGQSTLERWISEHKLHGKAAFPGKGHLRPDDEKLKKLERENEILRRERDILKKALAIFSSTESKNSNS
jgi:transposase